MHALKTKTTALVACFCLFSAHSNAQVLDIVALIKAAVAKAIQAADLEVQKLQTQTIGLQEAQKELENGMSQLRLSEIADWAQQTTALYQEYYAELWQVKQVISGYDKVKAILSLQEKIISEYQSAYGLFKQDKNFSTSEISYMYRVYAGILGESAKNMGQLLLVIDQYVTQMSDGERLNSINLAATGMQQDYNDLRQFDDQNIQLSLQRAAERHDIETVKKLYGLQ